MTSDLNRCRDKEGLLRYSIMVSGKKRHLVYRCRDDSILCPTCANNAETKAAASKDKEILFRGASLTYIPHLDEDTVQEDLCLLIGGGVYWRGPPLVCTVCERKLLSEEGKNCYESSEHTHNREAKQGSSDKASSSAVD